MNEQIKKALAALAENEAIYNGPAVGITPAQLSMDRFTSDENSMEFASKLMVPMTDTEGNKYYENLITAINDLDSKGTLGFYKALYAGQYEDAGKRGELEFNISSLHPVYDAPQIGEYDVPATDGADDFDGKLLSIGFREAAGDSEDNVYNLKVPTLEGIIVLVNGKTHDGFEIITIPGTSLNGSVKFNEDVPVEGDHLAAFGSGVKDAEEVIAKNKQRCDSNIKAVEEAAKSIEAESAALVAEHTATIAIKEEAKADSDSEAKGYEVEAEEAAAQSQEALTEAEALAFHEASLKARSQCTSEQIIGFNLGAEIGALKEAKASTEATANDKVKECVVREAEEKETQKLWESIAESYEEWNNGPDGDDAV